MPKVKGKADGKLVNQVSWLNDGISYEIYSSLKELEKKLLRYLAGFPYTL